MGEKMGEAHQKKKGERKDTTRATPKGSRLGTEDDYYGCGGLDGDDRGCEEGRRGHIRAQRGHTFSTAFCFATNHSHHSSTKRRGCHRLKGQNNPIGRGDCDVDDDDDDDVVVVVGDENDSNGSNDSNDLNDLNDSNDSNSQIHDVGPHDDVC